MLEQLLLIFTAVVQIFAISNEHRIIGGASARQGQFPYIASLKDSRSRRHFCGAGIIGKHWLLTAAHCTVGKKPSDFVAYVGSAYLDRYGNYHNVEKIVIHPSYDSATSSGPHDISMVKLTEDVELNENVKLIYLPFNVNVAPGEMATAVGWGSTSYPGGKSPNQLQYLTREIVSNADCSAMYEYNIISSQLCFGGDSGHGLCHADSGSPLIYVNKNKTYAIGVVSYGRPCAVGYPDVFAKVSHYIPWILQELYT